MLTIKQRAACDVALGSRPYFGRNLGTLGNGGRLLLKNKRPSQKRAFTSPYAGVLALSGRLDILDLDQVRARDQISCHQHLLSDKFPG